MQTPPKPRIFLFRGHINIVFSFTDVKLWLHETHLKRHLFFLITDQRSKVASNCRSNTICSGLDFEIRCVWWLLGSLVIYLSVRFISKAYYFVEYLYEYLMCIFLVHFYMCLAQISNPGLFNRADPSVKAVFQYKSTANVLGQVCVGVGCPNAVINLRPSSCHSPFH